MAMPDSATSASALLGIGVGDGDPADLLASLTAMSSSVTSLGPATIRGVPVTDFAFKVDPAEQAGTVPGADRASLEALSKLFGAAEIQVDVWVDGHNLVRQEKMTLAVPGGTRTRAARTSSSRPTSTTSGSRSGSRPHPHRRSSPRSRSTPAPPPRAAPTALARRRRRGR